MTSPTQAYRLLLRQAYREEMQEQISIEGFHDLLRIRRGVNFKYKSDNLGISAFKRFVAENVSTESGSSPVVIVAREEDRTRVYADPAIGDYPVYTDDQLVLPDTPPFPVQAMTARGVSGGIQLAITMPDIPGRIEIYDSPTSAWADASLKLVTTDSLVHIDYDAGTTRWFWAINNIGGERSTRFINDNVSTITATALETQIIEEFVGDCPPETRYVLGVHWQRPSDGREWFGAPDFWDDAFSATISGDIVTYDVEGTENSTIDLKAGTGNDRILWNPRETPDSVGDVLLAIRGQATVGATTETRTFATPALNPTMGTGTWSWMRVGDVPVFNGTNLQVAELKQSERCWTSTSVSLWQKITQPSVARSPRPPGGRYIKRMVPVGKINANLSTPLPQTDDQRNDPTRNPINAATQIRNAAWIQTYNDDDGSAVTVASAKALARIQRIWVSLDTGEQDPDNLIGYLSQVDLENSVNMYFEDEADAWVSATLERNITVIEGRNFFLIDVVEPTDQRGEIITGSVFPLEVLDNAPLSTGRILVMQFSRGRGWQGRHRWNKRSRRKRRRGVHHRRRPGLFLMAVARKGTLSPLAMLSDKAMARQLGASQTGRSETKTLSRRVVARSLGATVPPNGANESMRVDYFANAINEALRRKLPRSAGFASGTKTLSWQKPDWLLTTFYKVEKDENAFGSAGPQWRTLAARTSSLSIRDTAQNPSVNTQYRITAIAAMRQDQEAQFATVSVRATATLGARVVAPFPFFEGGLASATIRAAISGTATGTRGYLWSLSGIKNGVGTTSSADVGTLSSTTAAAPTWTPPANVDAHVLVYFNLELTRGALRITVQGLTAIFNKTLTVDLILGDILGETANYRYGGTPILLRKTLTGTALLGRPSPARSLTYSILDRNNRAATDLGTLSTNRRTAGTLNTLTTDERLVYWHLPATPTSTAPPPGAVNPAFRAKLAKIRLSATVSSETATDTEQAYLTNFVPTFSVVVAAVPNGNEGTTAVLSATRTGNATGAITYSWSVSAGTLSSATSASPTWTRPSEATTATISLTAVQQNISSSSSVTTEVTDADTGLSVPNVPRSLTFSSVHPTGMTIGWVEPAVTRGKARVTGYRLVLSTSDGTTVQTLTPASTAVSQTVTGLTRNTPYSISLQANSSVGFSAAVTGTQSTSSSDVSAWPPLWSFPA